MSEPTTPTPTGPPPKSEEKMKRGLGEFLDGAWAFAKDLTDLKDGLDKEGTIISIKNNKKMHGANAWLLMCSILIASLGLDLNSPAVIIGAMLISPLMAPILGIGLAVGINDRQTLNISGQHLLIAIAIAMFTSTVYFLITGWLNLGHGFTDEIRGRTSPNLLDATVAFVGGLAGIISSSRKDKSNAIPGVAIATALMPPLCVTGYGLANALRFGWSEGGINFGSVMAYSFFLFVLNATLVALSTYMIVRFMKFPQRTFDTLKEERKTKVALYIVSALLLGISVYTSVRFVQENKEKNTINQFMEDHFKYVKTEDCFIQKNIDENVYEVAMTVFTYISPEDSVRYNKILKDEYNIPNARVSFLDLPKMDQQQLITQAQKAGEERYKAKLAEEEQRKFTLDSLKNEIIILKGKNKKDLEKKLTDIISPAFPSIEQINFYPSDDVSNKPHAVSVKWNRTVSNNKRARTDREKRLNKMVIQLMDVDTVVVTRLE